MLFLWRALGPEVSRGLSTAAALWAGSGCPDCQCHPHLNCPEFPRCPDCSCRAGERIDGLWLVSLELRAFVIFLCSSCFAAGWAAGRSVPDNHRGLHPDRFGDRVNVLDPSPKRALSSPKRGV